MVEPSFSSLLMSWVKRLRSLSLPLEDISPSQTRTHQAQQVAVGHQGKDAPQEDAPQQADIPSLAPPSSPCIPVLLDAIHELSLCVDDYFDALTTHVNNWYNLLDEHISDLAS
ncbi:hypothetical protein GOBAR_DD32591 [Gossypium barbadense]|nr:hypothetical protein GOBAR_DD32591 [Gossypium barbadense]